MKILRHWPLAAGLLGTVLVIDAATRGPVPFVIWIVWAVALAGLAGGYAFRARR